MKKKLTPQSYMDNPGAGVGILSGFGVPDNPPDYNLDEKQTEVVPKADTYPGPGLNHLIGKVDEPDARSLLGEDK